MKEPYANNRLDYIINLIQPSKKDRVLNIGISNIPELEMRIEKKVKSCETIDIDKKKLERAAGFLKKTQLIGEDFFSYNFKRKKFNKIVILEVLEHLDKEEQAIKRINKLLCRGGALIISVPSDSFLHIINPVKYFEHKRHYSSKRLTTLLEKKGFKIEHINLVENWSLLVNLYFHILRKFFFRKSGKFNVLDRKGNKTYSKGNRKGMDIIARAIKII